MKLDSSVSAVHCFIDSVQPSTCLYSPSEKLCSFPLWNHSSCTSPPSLSLCTCCYDTSKPSLPPSFLGRLVFCFSEPDVQVLVQHGGFSWRELAVFVNFTYSIITRVKSSSASWMLAKYYERRIDKITSLQRFFTTLWPRWITCCYAVVFLTWFIHSWFVGRIVFRKLLFYADAFIHADSH